MKTIKQLSIILFAFFFVLNFASGQCTNCINSIGVNQNSITTTSSLSNPNALTGTWCLNGTLIIDNIFSFNSLILKMGVNSSI